MNLVNLFKKNRFNDYFHFLFLYLTLMRPDAFAGQERCEAACGLFSENKCLCAGSEFDPRFQYCKGYTLKENPLKDLIDETQKELGLSGKYLPLSENLELECRISPEPPQKLPLKYMHFSSLLDELIQEKKFCHQDKNEIRKRSLKLMNETLSHYFCDPPGPEISDEKFEDEKGFKKLMLSRWETILQYIARKPTTHLLSYPLTTNMNLIETALDSGVIPLPSVKDETVEGNSLFAYTSLRQYFLLGIAPVSIIRRTIKDFSQLNAHPMNGQGITDEEINFVGHDLDHIASFLSENFKDFDIANPRRCEQFQSCLDSLTIPVLNKKRAYNKIMLFFLLHENLSMKKFIEEESPYVEKSDLEEFAIEMVISREKFNLDQILGHSEKEKQATCAEIKYHEDLEQGLRAEIEKNEFSNYHYFRPKYKESIPSEKWTALDHVLKLRNELDKKQASFKNLKFLEGIFYKLKIKCEALFPEIKGGPVGPLEKGYLSFIKKGFYQDIENETNKMKSALQDIHDSFRKEPCLQLMKD